MDRLLFVTDELGNQVVLIPDIMQKNKQKIDWNEVEEYLKQFVGEIISITNTKDIVYLGKKFPDEFAGSKHTRNAKGARGWCYSLVSIIHWHEDLSIYFKKV